MVEGGVGPGFQVVFFDGEREMNIGEVKINPTLEYKPFQQMLSQKIGISPNQISIYLVDRKKSPKHPFTEDRRKIPITGKVNFDSICGLKDCCFLVVLKRSRKSRSRRERMANGLDFADFLPDDGIPPPAMHSVPENLVLLRRNQQLPFHDQITQSELANLNDRLQSLRVQRENYQIAMARGNLNSPDFGSGHGFETPNQIPNMSADLVPDLYLTHSATRKMTTNNDNNRKAAFCEECVNAEKNGKTASFHHCVNDAVVHRFTTQWGPIRRPTEPFL